MVLNLENICRITLWNSNQYQYIKATNSKDDENNKKNCNKKTYNCEKNWFMQDI